MSSFLREDLCFLILSSCEPMFPTANSEGLENWLVSPTLLTIFVRLGSSVGLSVAEVAEQVGVSTASIYFWETDHVRPRDANLSALCKVLKLPIRATREMAAA